MTQWFTESFRAEYAKQEAELGRVNIAVFGKTGVGKSTLVNAIFGEPVAATGIGAPVTNGSHLYLDKRGSLGVIDTRGLELGRDDDQIIKELTKAVKESRGKPIEEQIHVAWYCVRGMDRRFEDFEERFVRTLAALGLPVVLVLTQVPMREGQYHPDAVELARQLSARDLPIVDGHPFMTYAMRDQFTGQPPYGLVEVLGATFRVAPEAVQAALVAAQEVDLQLKASQSNKAVAAAVTAAAAAAAVPIPFSSAAMLVPIQLSMMARIAQLHGLGLDKSALLAIASTSVATSAGRAAAAGLLKFVPGAGSVVGGVINASVASSLTLAMGQAWLVVCQRAFNKTLPVLDGKLDTAAVTRLFESEMAKRMPKIRHRDKDA
ncbi:MAG: 50S ribosome-binding GTPase [Propionicimonas sp.]|uniref:GTPase family protein n=1 Tax=Propionicimonas sp. TaxID=1955623 RepID=UPI003D12C21B